jgi:hypothetical protein
MRYLALLILTVLMAATAAPVPAQTYNPDYPVCMDAYSIDGSRMECAYTSLAQCAQSASGLAAQCFVNPYPAAARPPARRSQVRPR